MRSKQRLTAAVAIIVVAVAPDMLAAQGSAPMPTVRQVDYYNPAWSPDDKWIAYESNADGKCAIYVVGADGTGRRRLTSGTADDVQASWSPDGTRLVFASNRDGHNQLYTMLADGSLQQPLSPSATRDFYATYSRDGRQVLFAAQDPRNRMLYYVGIVNADGTGRRILTDSTASAEGPRWTRDGTHIAFTRVSVLQPNAGEVPRDFIARRNKASERVWMTPAGIVLSPDSPGGLTTTPALASSDPALAPDGRRVAASRTIEGRPGIVLLDVATGEIVGVVARDRP